MDTFTESMHTLGRATLSFVLKANESALSRTKREVSLEVEKYLSELNATVMRWASVW